jgi:5-(carboxyamino)imidazole ribonucleotide synthase
VNPIAPGATIGVIGGGQLGRMLSLEARRMGYRVVVLDPDSDGPTAQVADECVVGALDDVEAAALLASRCDVVTLDTEHVSADLLDRLESITHVRPAAAILRIIQDRLLQREFLTRIGAPQPRTAAGSDLASLRVATRDVGFPCILKTRRSGYDGKGQARVQREADLDTAWQSIGSAPVVVEAFVEFQLEISVLLARDPLGNVAFFPVAENLHRNGVLHTTHVPARIAPALAAEADQLGARIASSLGHVGTMAVELFVTRDGGLLVNEIAPRTHNSGHYTFGACATSQFEQHVRAICGLPLGDPSLLAPAVMLNLLGDLWREGPPDWSSVFSHASARLHLYGKKRASPGRKMGHVLVVDRDFDRASQTVVAIEAELMRVTAG